MGRRCGRDSVGLPIGLAALAAGMLAIPAAAQAAPDASCPGPLESVLPTGSQSRHAQTFTAQTTGSLTAAQVVAEVTAQDADWTLGILALTGSGTPSDTALASTTIPAATVPIGVSTITGQFDHPAQVTAGQQYAIVLSRPGSSNVRPGIRNGNDCAGTLYVSSTQMGGFSPQATLDLVFTVFVDPPPEPGDTTAPDTTITKGPKDKTRKKTATFEFTGTDARAIASFQCKLDAGAFAPCTSPHTVRVKKGKHTFQVQAIDDAGNADGSPARDTWKRKKKRKR
jgi:hypothetical protein